MIVNAQAGLSGNWAWGDPTRNLYGSVMPLGRAAPVGLGGWWSDLNEGCRGQNPLSCLFFGPDDPVYKLQDLTVLSREELAARDPEKLRELDAVVARTQAARRGRDLRRTLLGLAALVAVGAIGVQVLKKVL